MSKPDLYLLLWANKLLGSPCLKSILESKSIFGGLKPKLFLLSLAVLFKLSVLKPSDSFFEKYYCQFVLKDLYLF